MNDFFYQNKRRGKKETRTWRRIFVCLFVFVRDSSQAQKLCSFLAGGLEPAPLLGCGSILLYSSDSLNLRLQLGEGRSAGAAPAQEAGIGSACCPPSSSPLSAAWGPSVLEAIQLSCLPELPAHPGYQVAFDV